MKQIIISLITALILTGCSNIVTVEEYSKIYKKNSPLTGAHSFYLGSDKSYHYLKVGNVMGSSIYRIKTEDFTIENTYSYNKENPTQNYIKIKEKP